jgi:REP element-mobilizing transposase RayT
MRAVAGSAYLRSLGYVRRTSLPDGYFHAYSRGVAGLDAFPDDLDRMKMVTIIRLAERKLLIHVLACVVMTTHFHIVVETTQEELSKALQWIKAVYARDFNKRHERFGAVFAERFSCRVIDSPERLVDTCRYVRANPLAAGLCEAIEDWPWAFGSWGLDLARF